MRTYGLAETRQKWKLFYMKSHIFKPHSKKIFTEFSMELKCSEHGSSG